jgi:integrase
MIEKLGKNKAKLIVNIGSGKNRRRKSKVVTYTTKKELEKMYRDFESEIRHNPLVDTTVEELVQSYIRSRKPLGVEATTIAGYETAAERIYPRLGSICAKDLTSYQVQEFIADMGEKYAPKTIRNTESLLSSAYDNAVRLGQLASNPCKLVTLPEKEDSKIDIFTEEEIKRFLNALRDTRLDYKVAYELALFCGLRRSEICGLREEHISIPFKTITIEETRHRVNGKNVVQTTKTATSHRHLAVPDFVMEDIKALLKEHQRFQYRRTDYLIQDGFGQPINPSTITAAIYRIEDKANLPHVSPHDLRHTFASMLNNAHVDIAMISRELGHSNISITLNTYTHVFGNVAESSRGIADSLNDKFDTNRQSATFLPLSENEKTAEA